MSNLTTVTITAGVPTLGTGTVSTIDALMADGGQATIGALADAAVTAGASGTIGAKLRSISRDIGSLVTGTVLAAGAALVGIFKLGDGTSNLTLLTASSGAPAATVVAVPVSIRDANVNGAAASSGSTPVVQSGFQYNTVAASAIAQALHGGGSGATGDRLWSVLIVPATTSPGAVSITDGSGSAITIFAGGASSVSNLVPFSVMVNARSTSGAWKVTAGSSVSAIAVGDFT